MLQQIFNICKVNASVAIGIINLCNFYFVSMFCIFIHALFKRRFYIKKCKLRTRNWTWVIASCNQFLESKLIKVHSKILEKATFERVVAITKYHFPTQFVGIMPKLLFNIN